MCRLEPRDLPGGAALWPGTGNGSVSVLVNDRARGLVGMLSIKLEEKRLEDGGDEAGTGAVPWSNNTC